VTFRRSLVRSCAICGSTNKLEEHHLGGFHHAQFFTITLCEPHHLAVTIAISRAGVDPHYTSDLDERARRARMAAYVFLWFLEEQIRSKHSINRTVTK
jgi:hypothetical protein